MPGKKLIRPALLILIPVLALILSVLLSPSGTPPSRPLLNPNGYDDFLKAAEALTGDVNGSSTMDHEALRQLVSSNAQPLQLLRLGLSRKCSVPTALVVTNLDLSMGDLPRLKSIGRLLVQEGRLAEMENRPGDAAHSYIDAIRFGNEASRGGVLIHRLVGIALQALGAVPLARLTPELKCEDARPVIAALQAVDEDPVPWEEILENERAYARYAIRHSSMNPVRWVVARWQARSVIAATKIKHDKVTVRLRLLIADLALRCCRAETGHPPAKLDELSPKYVHRVPVDPFSGKALIYRVEGTNWVLYSVGPDGVDDGGRSTAISAPGKGDLLFDSKW